MLCRTKLRAARPTAPGNQTVNTTATLPFLLVEQQLLPQPLLYLSAYFEQHRTEVVAAAQIARWCHVDGSVVFAVDERRRAPYPNEVAGLETKLASLQGVGCPLLVAPCVSDGVGAVLMAAGWSWADEAGNFDLRAPGLLLRQRTTSERPRRTTGSLPRGSGSTAIIRALVRFGEHDVVAGGASALARIADVSQPRASQVLGQHTDLGLGTKTGRGRWRPDREALLDRFLTEYAGPAGSQQFFYSLDAPNDVAVALASDPVMRATVAVSADVGPDLVVAWRRPSVLIIYARKELGVDGLDVVRAQGSDDANVIVVYPGDRRCSRPRRCPQRSAVSRCRSPIQRRCCGICRRWAERTDGRPRGDCANGY